jgi:uncharacterized protein YndB with AHSA1/START domain
MNTHPRPPVRAKRKPVVHERHSRSDGCPPSVVPRDVGSDDVVESGAHLEEAERCQETSVGGDSDAVLARTKAERRPHGDEPVVDVVGEEGGLVALHRRIVSPGCETRAGQGCTEQLAGSSIVGWVRQVIVTTQISAPPDRVWRALTDPSEVQVWDGVTPIDVPDDYPNAGQHARWSTRAGPLRLTLHDRIRVVDPVQRFASSIDVGFVHVEEDYRLKPSGPGSELVSANDVRSKIPGLDLLAARMTRSNVELSLERLTVFCEQGDAP